MKTWLRELSLAFEDTLFVVTSRTAAADQRWLAQEGFGCVLLEPMSSDDIEALVARWHKAAAAGGTIREGTDVAAVQRRLLNQLDSRPHLRTLAASPLLCAMLCALNLAHRSELPRDRMDLYRKALSMLLHLRDAERKIGVILTEAQKQILLGDLAWRLSLASKVELPKDRVREHIARRLPSLPHVDHTPDEVLNHLLERSGVLREPVRGRVDFVHRTFQECLAANEATEQDHVETLIDRAHLDTWRETIVMACGHAKHHQAGTLLTGILDRADQEPRHTRHLRLLAAACLETVSNADPEIIARVEAVIREQLVPPRSLRETRSLASIGHRVLRYLPPSLEDLSEAAAAATVRAAALTASNDALKLLRDYAQDSRKAVQTQLTRAWAYFDPEQFASTVLADSPLHEGHVRLETSRLLDYVHHLKNLTSLSLSLSLSEKHEDLSLLERAPHLQTIQMSFTDDTVLDVSTLADYQQLKYVHLYFAHRYTNVRRLSRLQDLEFLTLFRTAPWRGLDAFTGLPLRFLSLDAVHKADNLNILSSMERLENLNLWQCTQQLIERSEPMATPTDVSLYFDNNSRIAEVDAKLIAKKFPNVTELMLGQVELKNPQALSELPLHELSIYSMPAIDLKFVTALPTIRRLSLEEIPEPVDLAPLADLDITVELIGTSHRGKEQLGPGVRLIASQLEP